MNNKYKILLVEDEVNIRNMVSTLLENAGYQAIQARNCAEARTMMDSHKPDLIILDLGLPDGDGLTILKALREKDLTGNGSGGGDRGSSGGNCTGAAAGRGRPLTAFWGA